MRPHGAGGGSQTSGTPVGTIGREGDGRRQRPTEDQQVQDSVQHTTTTNTISNISILFQNINGLPVSTNHPKNDSIKDTIHRHNIDVIALSEVNIAWHQVPGNTRLGERSAEWFETRHISVAWNQTDPSPP